MNYWLAYGLSLRSNVLAAGMQSMPPAGRVDIEITIGELPVQWRSASQAHWKQVYVGESEDTDGKAAVTVARRADGTAYRLDFADGTEVFVEGRGESIHARNGPGASCEDSATYVFGPVLGFALRLRGLTCLHASAVAIDGRSVVFAGASETGKSSLAVAFARLGYPVLTDDVAALVDLGDAFEVQPAYPCVRLWRDAVEALFGDVEALPRLTPSWDKRYLPLGGATYPFQQHALPLAAIYFLGPRGGPSVGIEVQRVASREGLVALLAESFATRLLDRRQRAAEFDVLGRVAACVPLRRVTPPPDIARLPELCRHIVRDVGAMYPSRD